MCMCLHCLKGLCICLVYVSLGLCLSVCWFLLTQRDINGSVLVLAWLISGLFPRPWPFHTFFNHRPPTHTLLRKFFTACLTCSTNTCSSGILQWHILILDHHCNFPGLVWIDCAYDVSCVLPINIKIKDQSITINTSALISWLNTFICYLGHFEIIIYGGKSYF